MTGSPHARGDARFALAAQKVYPKGKLLRTRELRGGVSAQVTALDVDLPDGSPKKLLIRRHGAADLARNPHIAEDEFRLLSILRDSELPTPVPCYVDRSGELFSTPYIITEYIEGQPDFAPANLGELISQLALHLARIHAVTPESAYLSFLPEQKAIYDRKLGQRPAKLDESLGEGRIRDALEAEWPWPAKNASALLHGDFWPGNVLWRDGGLVGIIDWEDAHLGDPSEDLANSRLEVLWTFGVEAMHAFTQEYQALAKLDLTNLPHWDLCAALRPAFKITEWAAAGDASEKAMREKHRLFVAQAFAALARGTHPG